MKSRFARPDDSGVALETVEFILTDSRKHSAICRAATCKVPTLMQGITHSKASIANVQPNPRGFRKL